MRAGYLALQRLGRMSEATANDETIERFTDVADHLPAPETVGELELLLSSLPRSGETFYGLAWTLVHRLEASPLWLEIAHRYERPSYRPEDEWLETLHQRIARRRSAQTDSPTSEETTHD